MAAPQFSVNDYVSAMQALLPRGLAWPRDSGSVLTSTLTALAPAYYRTNAAAIHLLEVAFPATVDDLLPEWNATLGLPGLVGYTGNDLPTQQRQVVAALTDSGGQSADYFVDLASTLGATLTVSFYRPYTVDSPVDVPMYGAAWAFAWQVSGAVVGDYIALQTLFERYKPAHTVIVWNLYAPGRLLLESGGALLTEDGHPIGKES